MSNPITITEVSSTSASPAPIQAATSAIPSMASLPSAIAAPAAKLPTAKATVKATVNSATKPVQKPAAKPVATLPTPPALQINKAAPAAPALREKAARKVTEKVVVKAAVKTVAKTPEKAPIKLQPKVTAKVVKPVKPTKAAATAASTAITADKPKKAKLVRDSFTIPKAEYELLSALKDRAVRLKQPAKKSELLRAGIKLMVSLTDAVFAATLKAIPALKTGRPKAEAKAVATPAPKAKKLTRPAASKKVTK